MTSGQRFTVAAGSYAICRLPASADAPAWTSAPGAFTSVTRTAEELSIVCEEARLPARGSDGLTNEAGFALLKIQGPFPLDVVGVLSSVVGPLAQAGINVLALATFDTDYLLVKRAHLPRAIATLVEAGHTLVEE
jgi:hypothetical protein